MKTAQIPTTILIDPEVSYEAKGVYCYLYSRQALNFSAKLMTLKEEKKWDRCIRELIRNDYIEIKKNNVFFKK